MLESYECNGNEKCKAYIKGGQCDKKSKNNIG